MKNITLLLLMFLAHLATGQHIVVEKVRFLDMGSRDATSDVPKVVDTSNANNPVVAKINSAILEEFMIESFEQKKNEDAFHWTGITFTAEMKASILFIHYEGEYIGAYPSPASQDLFFSLSTGQLLVTQSIGFSSFFTLDGYLDFLTTYWLTGVKESFNEAKACADMEPGCSYYDIGYAFSGTNLLVTLAADCFPHVAAACNPEYSITVPLDSLGKYLSAAGKQILLTDRYPAKTGIDKFLYTEKTVKQLSNNFFLFGRIDNKYPVSMAFTVNAQGQVSGYYFYDRKRQKLTLSGNFSNNEFALTEMYNGKKTGTFSITLGTQWMENAKFLSDGSHQPIYLTGYWADPAGTKKLPIAFTAAKALTFQ